jgi:hypothetical protein
MSAYEPGLAPRTAKQGNSILRASTGSDMKVGVEKDTPRKSHKNRLFRPVWKSYKERWIPTFPTLLLRGSLSFFWVCETDQCEGERSQPALLKPMWE